MGDAYTIELTVPASGMMNIPAKVRERHLTADMEGQQAVVQAIGRYLLVTVPSDRDTIQFRLPFRCWHVDAPRTRSAANHSVNVNRWALDLAGDYDHIEEILRVPAAIETIEDTWDPQL